MPGAAPSWPRQAPSSVPPFAYLSPLGWKPLNRSRFHVSPLPRCGNLQRRKAISGGQILPRRSPPGRGDRRYHHHHRHGHHRDHHQHHPNISTISIYIQSHLTIATCVVIRTIYPLYSIGVDYYCVVNAIEFCWRNIIVSRLFITYLSPLIMISFMSCE